MKDGYRLFLYIVRLGTRLDEDGCRLFLYIVRLGTRLDEDGCFYNLELRLSILDIASQLLFFFPKLQDKFWNGKPSFEATVYEIPLTIYLTESFMHTSLFVM